MTGSQPPAGRWEQGDQIFPMGWGSGSGWEKGSQAGVACLQCCEVQVSSELLSVLLQISVIAGITCETEAFRAALLRWGTVEAKDSSIV